MRNSVYFWKAVPASLVALATTSMMLALLSLTACSNDAQQPAPMGDHTVLEQLAEAYRAVGERYPMQPQAMPPSGRKDFISKVFTQAGYSYSATLISVGQPGTSPAPTPTNQDHRDLVELLLLPNKRLSDEDLSSLYSEDEQAAVRRLRITFR